MGEPDRPTPTLCTETWYGGHDRHGFAHRSPDDAFQGKPIIGICNSASDLAPCTVTEVAEHVKWGVWESH